MRGNLLRKRSVVLIIQSVAELWKTQKRGRVEGVRSIAKTLKLHVLLYTRATIVAR